MCLNNQNAACPTSTRPYAAMRALAVLTLTTGLLAGCGSGTADTNWYKGNLHTHSLWSDGDHFPEVIVDWYASRDYHFLAISDHNTLQEGDRWRVIPAAVGLDGVDRLDAYRARFGDDWVEHVDSSGTSWVRLKTLEEYRGLFESDDFILFQSEEITDGFGGHPIHLNATNIQSLIYPQRGTSVFDVLQRNVDAVIAQREETGVTIVPHVNHPNFGWGLTPADLVFLQGEQFFEVYNGHPAVRNEGDSTHLSMEDLWDVVLAERLVRGWDVLYGIATDDAHNYLRLGLDVSNPGRGWIMVNADALGTEPVLQAMERGAFYASSGVTLSGVSFDGNTLTVSVDPGDQDQGSFRIDFVTTTNEYTATGGDEYTEIDIFEANGRSGIVASSHTGATASYTLRDNDLYVRAVVTSSRLKENPYQEGDFEQAWVQPVMPGQAAFAMGDATR